MHDRALLDNAALAAVCVAYRQYGHRTFAASDPDIRPALRRAVVLGWLWEPRDGVLAITADGVKALAPYHQEMFDVV